jgi:hypothetical protein
VEEAEIKGKLGEGCPRPSPGARPGGAANPPG